MPRLNRIVESALYVDDLARAGSFYREVLGLEPMLQTRVLTAFDIGGANVLLLFKRGSCLETQVQAKGSIPPHDGAGPLHLCFAIDAGELAAWEATLSGKGVAIEGRTEWPRGGHSLYFRDPDGHLLELMTPGNWPGY
jgi:catechol 2,3-dioxygenase-like lactoylglutathione lyase family enzyme